MKLRAISLFSVSLFVSGVAFGQATRTWVSGVGNDANPCSRTAPCKTYAGAISKTAAGGQISVLDPGGFGALTITKSLTIDGAGTLASTLHSGTSGIIISAGLSDRVTLRNLQVDGTAGATGGIGLNSINITGNGAKIVILENVAIMNGTRGVSATNNANTVNIYMSNVDILNPSTNGILLAPTGTGSVIAMLDGVRISKVGTSTAHDGISQGASTATHLKNVSVFDAAGSGLHITGAGALSTIEFSTFARSGSHGIDADAAGSVVRVGYSTSVQNFGAGFHANLGTIFSYHNNLSSDNSLVDSANTLQVFY